MHLVSVAHIDLPANPADCICKDPGAAAHEGHSVRREPPLDTRGAIGVVPSVIHSSPQSECAIRLSRCYEDNDDNASCRRGPTI